MKFVVKLEKLVVVLKTGSKVVPMKRGSGVELVRLAIDPGHESGGLFYLFIQSLRTDGRTAQCTPSTNRNF